MAPPLSISARPADDDHAYGHAKAEYFSSLAEGLMIMVAAATIAYAAIDRLLNPVELDKLGIGIAISVVASLINLGVALLLGTVGRRERSIALQADSKHLLTDVWTTAGVVTAVALVGITGIEWLDPVIGLLVAANIIIAGIRLVELFLRDVATGSQWQLTDNEILARNVISCCRPVILPSLSRHETEGSTHFGWVGGGMADAVDLKSTGVTRVGSNPTRPTFKTFHTWSRDGQHPP